MKILDQYTQKMDVRDFIHQTAEQLISAQVEQKLNWFQGLLAGNRIESAAKSIANSILNPIADRLLFQHVTILKVQYESVDSTGNNPATLSGLLIIPDMPNGQPSMPILGFQRGTEVYRKNAPSQFDMTQPLNIPEAVIGIILACLNGYIVAMADYQGMGEDTANVQPYVSAEPLARSVVDLLLNTKEYVQTLPFNRWNNQTYLAGYSQGGYVTMATARMIEQDSELAKKIPLTAVAPCSGPYSLSDAMRFLMLRNEHFVEGGHFILMAIRGFNATYGDDFGEGIFTKAGALRPEYQHLWDLANGDSTAADIHKEMPPVPRDCLSFRLVEELSNPEAPAFKVLQENDLINWKPNAPLHLYHNPSDDMVPFLNSEIAYNNINQQNPSIALSPSFYTPLGTIVHVEAAIPTLLAAYAWLNTFRHANKHSLGPGEFLLGGDEVFSNNKKFCLRYQLDGMLIYYNVQDMTIRWQANLEPAEHDTGIFIVQPEDGNLVVYNAQHDSVWASDTGKHPGSSLILTDAGGLEVIDSQGNLIKRFV